MTKQPAAKPAKDKSAKTQQKAAIAKAKQQEKAAAVAAKAKAKHDAQAAKDAAKHQIDAQDHEHDADRPQLEVGDQAPDLAREAGHVLLPLYQGKGNDGFFMAREVKALWLHVSAILRRLRLDMLVHPPRGPEPREM